MIKNQWKHFTISVTIFHIIGWIHWLLEQNPENIVNLWLFMIFVWVIVVIGFEINQMRIAVYDSNGELSPRDYWRLKWKDSLFDVIAGMVGCIVGILPFWLM
jgi:hypothetical protein